MSKFARELWAEWRRLSLPVGESRVVLAVSGGADSCALALACAELRRAELLTCEMLVAHLNHGLRGQAGAEDALWVAEWAKELGFAATVGHRSVGDGSVGDGSVGHWSVGRGARATGENLEQAARRARYEFLAQTAREWDAGVVLVAHTLDDQAETVLLRLLRGSGAEGLGGMRPVRRLSADAETLLARPLLNWARRADTESYCRERGVEVRTDEMNADERFARVRVRRRLLPLIETFNPRAVEALSRTAELLREDASALEEAAARLLEEACAGNEEEAGRKENRGKEEGSKETREDASGSGEEPDDALKDARLREDVVRTLEMDGAPPLRVCVLACAARALRRRALRRWIEAGRGDLRRVEMVHVAAVERLLEGVRGGRVAELPGGCSVERRRGWLLFRGVAASDG